MRSISLLRAGSLALALSAAIVVTAPAFAASVSEQSNQAQLHNSSSPYDGAASEAAKHAFY
jgi:hypothetical protein